MEEGVEGILFSSPLAPLLQRGEMMRKKIYGWIDKIWKKGKAWFGK